MDLKSYTKAINELTKAQYEESKYMFDPNAERIKKKRRAKDKLKKVLLRCAKLGISSKNVLHQFIYYFIKIISYFIL